VLSALVKFWILYSLLALAPISFSIVSLGILDRLLIGPVLAPDERIKDIWKTMEQLKFWEI
jgi:hypothetical protein